MADLARAVGGKPVLMAAADQFVSAIGRHAGRLADLFTFDPRGVAIQYRLGTKEGQYRIASQTGMPLPRARRVTSLEELAAFASTARFPLVLKPQHHRLWESCPVSHPLHGAKTLAVRSAEELRPKYELCSGVTPEIVVQEFIAGPDTAKFVYLACYGRNGLRLGSCIVRELRAWPIGFGSATAVELACDQEVDWVCDRFLRRIGYVGLCEIELKRDVRDGRLQMIEVNPRHSGTGDAAPYAGVELGWLHYLDSIGYEIAEVSPRRRAFRHLVLGRDVTAALNYGGKQLATWPQILRSYRLPLALQDLDLRDWRVARRNLGRAVRSIGACLARATGLRRRRAAHEWI
jgi:predicted ATP-grasp superfamily ATP-dependent carboligase